MGALVAAVGGLLACRAWDAEPRGSRRPASGGLQRADAAPGAGWAARELGLAAGLAAERDELARDAHGVVVGDEVARAAQDAELGLGSRSSASSPRPGDGGRPRRPTGAGREVEVGVGVEEVALGAGGPALGVARPGAGEVRVAADVLEGVAQEVAAAGLPRADRRIPNSGRKTARAACDRTRSEPGTAAARVAVRHSARRRPSEGGRCRALGMSTRRSGDIRRVAVARSAISAPIPCPPTSGRGPRCPSRTRR
jgi:hypothetical protein